MNRRRLSIEHRRILVLVIVACLIVQSVFITFLYNSTKREKIRLAKAYGESVATSIKLSLDKSIDTSQLLKNFYLEYGDEFYEDFDRICERLAKEDLAIGSLYMAPNGVVKAAYPATVRESTLGFNMLEDPEQGEKARLAVETKNITVAGPHALVEGGTGFIIRNPIFVNDKFEAFSIVVLDWDTFALQIIGEVADNNIYSFAVWKDSDSHAVTDDNGFILKNSDDIVSKDIDVVFEIPNDVWHLTVEPIGGYKIFSQILIQFIASLVVILLIIRTVYVRLKSAEAYVHAIEYDELTGLYNKQAFYIYAQKLLEKYPDKQFDIIINDVKNFKVINSIYGEKMGDEVLKFLGKLYTVNTRGNGISARFGSDQFIGFFEHDENGKLEWIEHVGKEIKEHAPVDNIIIKYGIYENVDRNLSLALMCDRALIAMKSIKHKYDQDVANFDGPISKRRIRAQELENAFDDAIKNEEFIVWYQPKFSTDTEELVGAEALVRWKGADGKLISPGEFIPVFEDDGLIVRLDEYVFRKVCKNVKEWLDKGATVVPISVNMSRVTISQKGIAKRYQEIVNEIGIPTEYVPIELTESAMLSNHQIREFADELKDAGFPLYMDDFGTGFSSLSSLNTMPFDVVKLDKSLIDYIGDMGGNEIVRHTIEMAHFKKMNVVAEGVESKNQLEILREYKCDTIQGYYYSAPKPYEEFVKYIKGL